MSRIASLPRRDPLDGLRDLAARLTQLVRTPTGDRTLFDDQALALVEVVECQGCFIAIRVGGGKALRNGTRVATPAGWVQIEQLKTGDYVIGSNGQPTEVLGVYPQGKKRIWEVRFSDERRICCSEDHLWTFRMRQDELHTFTTGRWGQEKLQRRCGAHHAHRVFTVPIQPVDRDPVELPVDPYTLGAILGDGCCTDRCAKFTSMDQDIVDRLRFPGEVRPVSKGKSGLATEYSLTQPNRGPKPNPLTSALKKLGLMGHKSYTKFIPDQYFSGSLQQRLELLQGLCDTDGSVHRPGSVEFSSMSKALATGIQELAESLGGTAVINQPKKAYRVNVKLPKHLDPFYCQRKREAYRARDFQRPPYRAVTGIRKLQVYDECTCIKVAAEDGLFATEGYVLTHNTATLGMIPTVLGIRGEDTLLFVPAKHVNSGKTERELAKERRYWKIPPIVVKPYSALSVRTRAHRDATLAGLEPPANILEERKPRLILFDEAHFLKNVRKSRRARIVAKYLADHPDVIVVVASGTMTRESILDYAHLQIWSLRARAPMPRDPDKQALWAALIDPKPPREAWEPFTTRPDFAHLAPDLGPVTDQPSAWRAFRERQYQSRGVITSTDEYTGSALTFTPIRAPVVPQMEDHWKRLRELWAMPDDWTLSEQSGAAGVWANAHRFTLGFYYKLDPRPPQDWLDVRKAWAGACRRELQASDRFHSEGEIADACVAKTAGTALQDAWGAWDAVRRAFVPNQVAEWLHGQTLAQVAAWGSNGGIVWSEYVEFGTQLSRLTGWPYYGRQGRTRDGESILDARAPTIICSRPAIGDGFNLQTDVGPGGEGYHRNLLTTPLKVALDVEQTIGRTHREGQRAATVGVDYLVGCTEGHNALECAVSLARWTAETRGEPQKLLTAAIELPPAEWIQGAAYGIDCEK